MTLTQVSTWFANARRRLKKENGLKEDTDESIDDKGWSILGSLITGSNLNNNSPF